MQNLAVRGSNQSQIGFLGSMRAFSSHDDHLSKQDVVDRVLDVVKSFPKVDPAKVQFRSSLKIYSDYYQTCSLSDQILVPVFLFFSNTVIKLVMS